MMDEPTFADLEYQGKKRRTRRELFLQRMDGLIPWQRLEERIRPAYPKPGKGRRPYPLPVMLRVHCVQLFYNLSDPGMEDLLYEAESVRQFVGLSLAEALPDETTILNFRHLLERHELGEGLLEEINAHLESQGLRLKEGTIVDASIIEAPSSTKNRAGERDPEMHQTKKGNQWHFGMKAHIGVDSQTGVVHSLTTTAANAHDVTEAHRLLHGGETQVWCDAGYQGVHKRDENLEREVEWQVAMRPGKRRKLDPESPEALAEKSKASVRAKSLPPTTIGGGAPVPESEAGVRLRQGSLPGAGEEHGASGAAFWIGQPADGGESTDRVTWAQWAQTRPRAPGRAGQRPQRRRWGEMGGRNIRGNGPGSRGFPRNSSDNHQKALAALVQSILSRLRAAFSFLS